MDAKNILSLLEAEEAKPKDDFEQALVGVLGVIYLDGLSRLRMSCDSKDIFSDDRIVDSSKPTLSIACLTACLGSLSKKIKETSIPKSPDKKAVEKTLVSTKSDGLDEKNKEKFEEHKKQFDKVFVRVVKDSEAKLKEVIKNPDFDKDIKPPKLSVLIILDALSKIDDPVPKSEKKESLQPARKDYSSQVSNLLETVINESGDKNSYPWDRGPAAVQKEFEKRYSKDKQALHGALYRIYNRLHDPKK